MIQIALSRIEQAKKEKLQSLNLTELSLLELPKEIVELDWLESLFMSFNLVSDISILATLKNIKRLDLRGNKISDIKPLNRLQYLTYLDLDRNLLSEITAISNFENLEVLYLSNNNITDITPLEGLKKLIELDLSNNKITDITALSNIFSITKLNLSENTIFDVFPLGQIKKIENLNICKNSIRDLSPLEHHFNLKKILFGSNNITDLTPISEVLENGLIIKEGDDPLTFPKNNPLLIPPPEIVNRGTYSIKRYFEEILIQGSDKIYEAKILIIGEGGVGKTSLAMKIADSSSRLPSESETTFGIEISRLPIMKMPNNKTFYINIWDFGGQSIYHSTHQFFLTHRSLYLLVDDTRKDDKSVYDSSFSYWLRITELLGENSPLIIIQNEKSDRSKDIDLKSMQGRYNFIKECKQTNLETNRGLPEIMESVRYWLKQLPHVGETLPKQWVAIRRDIEILSQQREFISYEDFLKICLNNKIPQEKKALEISTYLHDLGVFLHYQDNKVLQDIIILKNNWATDAVYHILDDEIVKRKRGFITEIDLERNWSDARYRRKQSILLALLEKFEICYPVESDRPTWFVPQLLPISTPQYDWDFLDNLVVIYRYNFLPKGLLSRLIVRLKRYVKNTDFAWKSGVLIERDGAKAVITETYSSGEIVIRAQGSYSRDIVSIISDELDDLNKTFEQLQVNKLIPCNCSKCLNASPYFFDYQRLKMRLAAGRSNIDCDSSFEAVDIRSLIDGVFTTVTRKRNTDMKVFISYSHIDESLKEEFVKHLSILKLTNNLSIWSDSDIAPSTFWRKEIADAISSADVIFFLISVDFINSKFIWENELPIALERNKKGSAIVIPIFMRPCHTDGLAFMELQGLPRNAKAISTIDEEKRDAVYAEIVRAIEKRIFLIERG